MSKAIHAGLSYRKQYAIQCLLKGINSRARDNCYEMGDGDEVVRHIMKICLTPLPPMLEMESGKSYEWNSPEYKAIRKSRAAHKRKGNLINALKESGLWEGWLYFFTHGSYDGYNREVS